MPTPFMHLQMAERIRIDPQFDGRARQLALAEWPAFYLGSVAADYQTIFDVPREQTHFYNLPPDPDVRAEEAMLAAYPELARAGRLSPGRAVFVAAYRAHLMLDLIWYRQVLVPYFLHSPGWEGHRSRFIVHNTLLSYLDRLALDQLPASAGSTLAAAEPDGWLPFASDEQLRLWRDMLAAQLAPGQPVRTVEIYADRLRMTSAEFAANLDRPDWMAENVFRKAPLAEIQEILGTAVGQSVDLIVDYLA